MRKLGMLILLSAVAACQTTGTSKESPTNAVSKKSIRGISFIEFGQKNAILIDNLVNTEILRARRGAAEVQILTTRERSAKIPRRVIKGQFGSFSSSGTSTVSDQEEGDITLVRFGSGSDEGDVFLICGELQNPCSLNKPGVGQQHDGCGGTFDSVSENESIENIFAINQEEIETSCRKQEDRSGGVS